MTHLTIMGEEPHINEINRWFHEFYASSDIWYSYITDLLSRQLVPCRTLHYHVYIRSNAQDLCQETISKENFKLPSCEILHSYLTFPIVDNLPLRVSFPLHLMVHLN